ncbi:hypothetical protein ABT061_34970 [Streptosporangium sp. NPDC002544]|uniref:hypothetical protein n=1 Tax=Streptosporangium sp. NPDC002544 TaxID=3154538 RepID=UPI003333807D
MRFARNALAAAGLAIALLHVAAPAAAAATPSPVPSPAQLRPAEQEPPLVPEGAPETGGGLSGSVLVPVGGVLLVAGAGTGLLALRRRKHTQV